MSVHSEPIHLTHRGLPPVSLCGAFAGRSLPVPVDADQLQQPDLCPACRRRWREQCGQLTLPETQEMQS
jgi:hypothetical protein